LFPLFVALVYGRSLAGIAGWNPAEDMDVYFLSVLCVVRSLCDWPITRPEESYRVCVIACDVETSIMKKKVTFNPLNAALNPICHLLALLGAHHILHVSRIRVKGHFNPLNAELNPICHLLALLRAHHILHVGRVRVKGHFNPLNAELNPICHLLALLGAHHIFHVSELRINLCPFCVCSVQVQWIFQKA